MVERVSPVFVGREDLLALAERRWAASQDGPGQLLLVTGEVGIGKSRFFREIAARLGPVRTVWGNALPRETAVPGLMLLDLADNLDRDGMSGHATALREILLESDPAGDAAHARRIVTTRLADALAAILAEQPTLLRFEDLHWADEFSLDVLERLAQRLRTAGGFVLANYRDDALRADTTLGQWRARVLDQRLAEEVRLGRLDATETARMMEALSGDPAAATSAQAMLVRSDGIPLHIEELLDSRADATIPESVAAAISVRASALAPDLRALLEAASVIGRAFDADLLEAITKDEPSHVDAGLRELADRHFVVAYQDGIRYGFQHSLICDVVYGDIWPNRRRELHAAVAESAAIRDHRHAFLSEHFERASQPREAFEHARLAAIEAARVSAHREAASLYQRAQRTAPADVPLADRARMLAALAVELATVDDNAGAAQAFDESIELYRELGDETTAAGFVPQLMSVRHLLGDDLQQRTSLAHDALARLEHLPDAGDLGVRSRLWSALASEYLGSLMLDDAAAAANTASALGASDMPPTDRIDLDLTLGTIAVLSGRPDEGWAMLESALTASKEGLWELQTARAYRAIGSTAAIVADYPRALRWIPEGIDETARFELWNHRHQLVVDLAQTHWAMGDWDEAGRLARQALADGAGSITTRITALTLLGFLMVGRLDLPAARGCLEEALAIAERLGEVNRLTPVLGGLAELALAEGDAERAVALCERAHDATVADTDATGLFPVLLTGTRALLALPDAAQARRWVARSAPLLTERGIPGSRAALDHAEGLLALNERRSIVARELLERARAGWDALGRFWEAAQVRIDLARCAQLARRPAEAAAHADEVRTRASTVRSGLLEAQLATLRAEPAGSESAGALTAREFEVARLVAAGSTNREIAQTLVISPKTVSAHIEHILAKLGMARRTEIAAWVSAADSGA